MQGNKSRKSTVSQHPKIYIPSVSVTPRTCHCAIPNHPGSEALNFNEKFTNSHVSQCPRRIGMYQILLPWIDDSSQLYRVIVDFPTSSQAGSLKLFTSTSGAPQKIGQGLIYHQTLVGFDFSVSAWGVNAKPFPRFIPKKTWPPRRVNFAALQRLVSDAWSAQRRFLNGGFERYPFNKLNRVCTLWLFNMAMENGPFIDDLPINTSIYKGFSMAMLNNQMVTKQGL